MIAVARMSAVACVLGMTLLGAVLVYRFTVIVAGGVLVVFGSRMRGLVVSAVVVSVGGRWVGVGA
ncbi:hypothetical protein IU436_26555 [Nocardia farcinica]|uniref:hypothetical protein n=1 Tax=Nocardia TaxID=1817 RepID=UPI001893B7C1|nr:MULTISPECIES: hypothetical protein [Nocardia]MBF6289965.1 hypothetical protein [Nocardia cyriacigeorgica]MBF6422252.1 hypothetical protein [Nocardia farcinica]MBF6433908.1 hypothetical protein [Nocardia farcinica]MBF6504976.1 hypothetical protein [Nocardia farcinica]